MLINKIDCVYEMIVIHYERVCEWVSQTSRSPDGNVVWPRVLGGVWSYGESRWKAWVCRWMVLYPVCERLTNGSVLIDATIDSYGVESSLRSVGSSLWWIHLCGGFIFVVGWQSIDNCGVEWSHLWGVESSLWWILLCRWMAIHQQLWSGVESSLRSRVIFVVDSSL